MRIVKLLFVYLHVGFSVLQHGISHPTTTDFPTETTTIGIIGAAEASETTTTGDLIFETTNFKEYDESLNFDDATTETSNFFEETTIAQNVTQNQQDVVEELNGLWTYSESLDETEQDLKSSLNSIVHLAYARVQIEPDETLGRLKNLLRKLRSRLSRTTTDQRSWENVNNGNRNENDNSRKMRMRRKRDIPDIVEHLITASSQSSILQQQVQNQRIPEEQLVSTGTPLQQLQQSIPVPAGDTTIQKVIHVGDRELEPPANANSNANATEQSESSFNSQTIIQTNLLMNNESGALPSAITAENIANAILKLLHQNTLPHYIDTLMHAERVNFSTSHAKIKIPEIVVNYLQQSTTTKPPWSFSIPPDIFDTNSAENELMGPNSEEPEAVAEMNLETDDQRNTIKWSEIDFEDLLYESDILNNSINVASSSMENTNSPVRIPSSSIINGAASGSGSGSGSSSPMINMFDELSSSNIMSAPLIILNGTKEGMIQFIQTFNILTFKTKMAILFALSVSVLSIALGVYSLGPPIIAVGALGILIPIMLLLALQSQDQDLKKKKDANGNTIRREPLEEFDYILDLILDAMQKYNM